MIDLGAMEIETVAPADPEVETARDPPPQGTGPEIELRMLELRHRIKNILAVVQSLVNQTLREGVEVSEARQVLTGRLGAIGHAVDLLLSDAWDAAPLGKLIRSAMTSGSRRVRLAGPEVEIGSSTAMMLSILFHEMECNAIKYGALSTDTGVVTVSWRVEGAGTERLVVDWVESGGPAIDGPVQQGFGTTLVSKIAARFDGGAITEFSPDGLRWRFSASLESLQS
jgi:two-component sensor histidine kinase